MTILLFIVATIGFVLSAIAGGGASMILLPVLSFLLPIAQVPAALSLGASSSSLARIVTFHKQIRWDVFVWFFPFTLPCVWLGAWLLTYINPLYIEVIIGFFLLSNFPLLFRKSELNPKPMPKAYLLLIGGSAGFISGMTGAVGLLFNKFYLRLGLTKEQIIATRAANEILLQLVKLVLYASFGLITSSVWLYGIVIAVAAIIASLLTKRVLGMISEAFFHKLAYGSMVVAGLFLFSDAAYKIYTTDNIALTFSLSEGLDTQLQWRKGLVALEFRFDEGFEFEQVIDIKDLPADKQKIALEYAKGAQSLQIEAVYSLNEVGYEAYIAKDGKVTKVDF